MPPIRQLISQLRNDFPDITFVPGGLFRWSKATGQITYNEQDADSAFFLLHELAHAQLTHANFRFDIELITQEREAWDYVRSHLAPRYNLSVNEQLIEEALDTYRNWLHERSTCPQCNDTGLQTKTSTYVCLNCRCSWRPNDARQHALRRYIL